jgi:hypothetical protein
MHASFSYTNFSGDDVPLKAFLFVLEAFSFYFSGVDDIAELASILILSWHTLAVAQTFSPNHSSFHITSVLYAIQYSMPV